MQPFLYTTAQALYQQHGQNLHRLAIVFPNRRQAVFFRDYFRQIATPPAFLPQLLTIEELVQQLVQLPVADNLVQSFELYQCYKRVWLEQGEEAEKLQDFEQFFPIGEMLLKDFAEVDSFLAGINEICQILYDLEAIEKSFEQLTDEQKDFLHRFWASVTNKGKYQDAFLKLWKRLPLIYSYFQEALAQQGYTTMGMAYRQAANRITADEKLVTDWDHIAFVGFNAFNKAEETILLYWQQQGLASLWLDADEYYVKDSTQEAGFFLRRNLQFLQLKNSLPLHNIIGKKTNTIHVTAVQGHTAQAKMIGSWLQQLPANSPNTTAAILLADESLLLPALQSLPDDVQAVNVTMGYPVQQSALYSFFLLYKNIVEDLTKNRHKSLHYSFVQQWMNHPLCDWEATVREKISEKMQKGMLIQVPVKMLLKLSPSSDLLLMPFLSDFEIFSRLRQLLQHFHSKAIAQVDALLTGVTAAIWQLLQVAEPLFTRLQPAPSLQFMLQVLQRQLSSLTIPFQGEPLRGIQLMGLLESRGLDFEHILLLGAAEGALPKVSVSKTFLPDGVRRAFGLPVAEYQDAISAYVFYRLLHHGQHLHLVYNSLVADNSTGEPSRFVKQLAFESKMAFEYHYPTTQIEPTVSVPISIEKTPAILNILKRYYEGEKPVSFSPSQINTYLACRLQFFFRQVAGITVPDELSEAVDAAMFGNIVHKVMERLYELVKQGSSKGQVTKETITWLRDRIATETEAAFASEMTGDKAKTQLVLNGLQQVIKNVAIQYVEGFLKLDEAYAPFTVTDIEVKMNQPFSIQIGGSIQQLRLNGYIDRVDEKDGVYRMVDYKTGADKHEYATIEKLFEREGKKTNKAALQTLIYSWMFQKQHPQLANFEPALMPLRSMTQAGVVSTRFYAKESKSFLSHEIMPDTLLEVEERLRQVLEEIFDPAVPFTQTNDETICSHCDYNGICSRG